MILFISFFMFSLAFSSSDAVAAVVGNKIILKSSVQEQVNMFLQRSPSSSVVGLESSVLNHLIEQEVLVYFAEKDTSLLVDFSRADMIVDERFDFFKKNLGSVSAVEDYFGSSKTEIKDVLLKEARSLLLAESFKQKLYSGVSVSYNDVSSFYLSYKDSLPLTPFRYNYSIYALPSILKTPSLEKSFATADSVFAEIKKGSPFDGFYSLYSGGDLGSFRRGTFIQEFEEAAFSLKEGDISRPVLSSLGVHIIRLNSRLGEKIDVSHILFTVDKDLAEKESFGFVNDIRKTISSTKNKDSYFDSLISSVDSPVVSGFFKGVPASSLDKSLGAVFDINKNVENFYSDVLKTSSNYFAIARIDSVYYPSVPDLYEHWGFIESLALEKKYLEVFDSWYKKNKHTVYIKKY